MPYSQQSVPASRAQLPGRNSVTARPVPRRQSRYSQQDSQQQTCKRNNLLCTLIITALCFGILQATRTLVQSTYQLTILTRMLPSVDRYYSNAQLENRILKDKIHRATTTEGIESLARNYLNMTTDHEILIRFH